MFALVLAIITAVPGPSPTASAEPLKTIVTVRSSPFCSEFATHVNAAIDHAVRNDATLGSVILTLHSNDLAENDLSRHNEIQRLENLGDSIYRDYRKGLDEVGKLRDLAKTASDEQEKTELTAAADALGGVLYRQHLIQRDLDGFTAYLDMTDMQRETNHVVLNREFGPGYDMTDAWSDALSTNYMVQQHIAETSPMHPPEQDVEMAGNASRDFEHRIPDILRDELTAGGHITEVSDRC
ncbi:MAG: hypothetical protein JO322_15925 [Candidatus Eremiobacteraeota bacterium]|nr:hypothetical protein [Candidatus Eremiobacteraeota bacterium]